MSASPEEPPVDLSVDGDSPSPAPAPPPSPDSEPVKETVVKKRKIVSMAGLKPVEINRVEDDITVPNDKYSFRESLRVPSSSLVTMTTSNHNMFGDPEISRWDRRLFCHF